MISFKEQSARPYHCCTSSFYSHDYCRCVFDVVFSEQSRKMENAITHSVKSIVGTAVEGG